MLSSALGGLACSATASPARTLKELWWPLCAALLIEPGQPSFRPQALWPQLEAVARAKGLRLGSPSASPSGDGGYLAGYPQYKDNFAWMDDFMAACSNW